MSSYHQEFGSISFSGIALTLNITFISANGKEKMVHQSISYNSKNLTSQTLYILDSRKLILLIVGYSNNIMLSWHIWSRHARELYPILLSCKLWCKQVFLKVQGRYTPGGPEMVFGATQRQCHSCKVKSNSETFSPFKFPFNFCGANLQFFLMPISSLLIKKRRLIINNY